MQTLIPAGFCGQFAGGWGRPKSKSPFLPGAGACAAYASGAARRFERT